jgi:uncharacterized protein YbaR (Trm112 family)
VIDPELLEMLGCPLHPERPPFRLEGEYLVCTAEGHAFPIVDGIPHLLPEDAIAAEDLPTARMEGSTNGGA